MHNTNLLTDLLNTYLLNTYLLTSLLTLSEPVGMGSMFQSVCLIVCLQHNSKMKDLKVFKHGVGNDLGIS